MPGFVGEDEVIRRNMGLAKERMFTVEDVEAMPEDSFVELIDGRLYYMAAPTANHQEIVHFLDRSIGNYIQRKKGTCSVYPSPFAVYLNEDSSNYFMPDLMVVCDRSRIRQNGYYGAPDLVAEVVSRSSRSLDYLKKLVKYEQAGVREYWIVDPLRKTVMVYNFEAGEMNQYTFAEAVKVNIFEDLFIDFSELVLTDGAQ